MTMVRDFTPNYTSKQGLKSKFKHIKTLVDLKEERETNQTHVHISKREFERLTWRI